MRGNFYRVNTGRRSEYVRVLFTYRFNSVNYIVYIDPRDSTKECFRRLCYSPWKGAYIHKGKISDNAWAMGICILRNVRNSPDGDTLMGEHYLVKESVNADGAPELKLIEYNRLPALGFLAELAPAFVKLVFLVLVSALFSFIYLFTVGTTWTPLVFGDMPIELLAKLICFIEIPAAVQLFCFRQKRDLGSILLYAILPLSVITVLAALKVSALVRISVAVALVICLILVALPKVCRLVAERIPSKLWFRIKKLASGVFLTISLCVVAGSVCANFLWVCDLTTAKDKLYQPEQEGVETAQQEYTNALMYINETVWSNLDEEQRLVILQAVSDYECLKNLGCEPATVEAFDFESDSVFGDCSWETNTIRINSKLLSNGHVTNVLTTLLHETRHAWQKALVQRYTDERESLEEEYINLYMLGRAYEFKSSYENYSYGFASFEDYYNQAIEIDSRRWSEEQVESVYESFIYADLDSGE